MTENKYSATHHVRSYEASTNHKIKPVELLNLFQEAADLMCLKNNMSLSELVKTRNMGWVLHRYKIIFYNLPAIHENFNITTWCQTKRDLFSIRDFIATNNEGKNLALATSTWILLDLATKKPVKCSEIMKDFPLCTDRAITEDLKSLRMPQDAKKISDFNTYVFYSNIDINGHVNHTVYITWALESLGANFLKQHTLTQLNIQYKVEALAGDKINCEPYSTPEENVFMHRIMRGEEELCLVESRWSKN